MVETRIYGVIGADVTSASIAAELAALDGAPDLTVRINSRGGDVFEGVAILNSLRGYGGHVTTVVDGLAASAASFIVMAGAEIVMNRNSEMMIHNGSTLAIGGAEDMRKMADNLERVNANIANIYAERAGGTPEAWRALMADETWFSAEEAVKAGLADRVEAIKGQDANKVKAFFDLSIFNHAGRANAPAPPIVAAHNETPQPVEAEVNRGKEGAMPTLNEGLAELFGTPADADDETILQAAKNKLEELSTAAEPAEPAEPTLEQATQVAAQFDSVVVNRETFASLQAQAQSGAEARAQQVREGYEREVDAAILQGRIGPASRESFLNYFAADTEGARRALSNIAPNTVPLAEQGHGVSNDITSEDDAVYASLFGKDA